MALSRNGVRDVAGQDRASEVLTAGDIEVRPGEYLARVRGRALTLSLRELDLLAALVRRHGHVVGRDELYRSVWGGELREHDRSVDVYVHKLRAKLADAVPDTAFIHTHFGFGYRFQPDPSQALHTSATER